MQKSNEMHLPNMINIYHYVGSLSIARDKARFLPSLLRTFHLGNVQASMDDLQCVGIFFNFNAYSPMDAWLE